MYYLSDGRIFIILFYDCISLLIVLYEGGRGLVSIVKVYKTF